MRCKITDKTTFRGLEDTVNKKNGNWKKMIMEIDNFLKGMGLLRKERSEPFDRRSLKLVAIDFIS